MPKKPNKKVVQMNVEAVVMLTDAKGEVVSLAKHGACLMEANFDMTFRKLAKEILKAADEQAAAKQEDANVAAAAGKAIPVGPR